MQVPRDTINSILSTMPPGQRREVEATLRGRHSKTIHCLSQYCRGRHIGNIVELNGAPRPQIRGVVDSEGKQWLRVHRFRFDGFLGFKCACGNDSRIAEQERGIFDYKGTVPDKDGMNEIFARVQRKPSKYPVVDGEQNIDGFLIKEVR